MDSPTDISGKRKTDIFIEIHGRGVDEEFDILTNRRKRLKLSPALPENEEDNKSKPPKKKKYDINTSSISHLLQRKPYVFYRSDRDSYVLRVVRKRDGKWLVRNFRSLKHLQNFVNSKHCLTWLSDTPSRPTKGQSQAELEMNIRSDYLLGNPYVFLTNPDKLILVCQHVRGMEKTRTFKCNSRGISDKVAMKNVRSFLNNPSFETWINDGWIFKDSVSTGVECRQYIDNLYKFNTTKRVIVNAGWRKYLNIEHHPDVCARSVAPGAKKWGNTHRTDDMYSMKQSSGKLPKSLQDKIPVQIVVQCSSKSDKCRSQCGILVSDCHVEDDVFTCCKLVVSREKCCCHCLTRESPSDIWYKTENVNDFLCKLCYNYQIKYKRPRPISSVPSEKTSVARIKSHAHLQCSFRLRFQLQPDLKTFHIYEHAANQEEHADALPIGKRRFTLTERDEIDKLRSSTSRPTANQINLNLQSENKDKHLYLGQIQSRCDLVDRHLLGQDIMQNGTESGLPKSKRTRKRNVDSSKIDKPQENAMNSRKSKESNTNSNGSGNLVITCYKCLNEGIERPFQCATEKELNAHMRTNHQDSVVCCSICLEEDNVVVVFPTVVLLKNHIKLMHEEEKKAPPAPDEEDQMLHSEGPDFQQQVTVTSNDIESQPPVTTITCEMITEEGTWYEI